MSSVESVAELQNVFSSDNTAPKLSIACDLSMGQYLYHRPPTLKSPCPSVEKGNDGATHRNRLPLNIPSYNKYFPWIKLIPHQWVEFPNKIATRRNMLLDMSSWCSMSVGHFSSDVCVLLDTSTALKMISKYPPTNFDCD